MWAKLQKQHAASNPWSMEVVWGGEVVIGTACPCSKLWSINVSLVPCRKASLSERQISTYFAHKP